MITNVSLVVNDLKSVESIVNDIKNVTLKVIDEATLKGKKEAFKLKGHWGARETPFAICYDGNKPIKAFYSESENVLESLINYLNENYCNR